jgi:hypothetical protein
VQRACGAEVDYGLEARFRIERSIEGFGIRGSGAALP